jgi:hypothetical protein
LLENDQTSGDRASDSEYDFGAHTGAEAERATRVLDQAEVQQADADAAPVGPGRLGGLISGEDDAASTRVIMAIRSGHLHAGAVVGVVTPWLRRWLRRWPWLVCWRWRSVAECVRRGRHWR